LACAKLTGGGGFYSKIIIEKSRPNDAFCQKEKREAAPMGGENFRFGRLSKLSALDTFNSWSDFFFSCENFRNNTHLMIIEQSLRDVKVN